MAQWGRRLGLTTTASAGGRLRLAGYFSTTTISRQDIARGCEPTKASVTASKIVRSLVTRTRVACPLPGAQATNRHPYAAWPLGSQSDPFGHQLQCQLGASRH